MRRVLRYVATHWAQLILILLVVLIGFRVALPYLVKRYVNRTLSQIQGYGGHVDDVSIHLWRGAYSVRNLTVEKTDGHVPVPLFYSPVIDFSLEWTAIFEGALVAKIKCEKPELNFVAGPTRKSIQVGVAKLWLYIIKQLVPLHINRFEITDGSVHYLDFYSTPKVNLKIDQIHMVGLNLTNTKKYNKTLVSNILFDGRAFESAHLWIQTQFDPSTPKATFDLSGKLDAVPLREFNDFAEAYGKFHFQKGTLLLVCELAAKEGELAGYIKPLLDGVAIIDLRDAKNPLKLTWETVVAGTSRLLRNQPNNRFATKIPISGSLDNPQADLLDMFGNIFKNEFIKMYDENFDSGAKLKQIEKENDQPKH